jgi:hypothetical protein
MLTRAQELVAIGNCHIAVEQKVGDRVKQLHQTGQFGNVMDLIKTLGDGHSWAYCSKKVLSRETSYSPGVKLTDLDPYRDVIQALAIYNRQYFVNNQEALIASLGLSPLRSPNQMTRSNGSYLSSECEKAVPIFKKNLSYQKSNYFYYDAKNPACFGVEGGIKIPYTSFHEASNLGATYAVERGILKISQIMGD